MMEEMEDKDEDGRMIRREGCDRPWIHREPESLLLALPPESDPPTEISNFEVKNVQILDPASPPTFQVLSGPVSSHFDPFSLGIWSSCTTNSPLLVQAVM